MGLREKESHKLEPTNLQTRLKKEKEKKRTERDGKLDQQPSRVSAAIPNLALLSGPCGQCHLCGIPDQHTHLEERTTSQPRLLFLESFFGCSFSVKRKIVRQKGWQSPD